MEPQHSAGPFSKVDPARLRIVLEYLNLGKDILDRKAKVRKDEEKARQMERDHPFLGNLKGSILQAKPRPQLAATGEAAAPTGTPGGSQAAPAPAGVSTAGATGPTAKRKHPATPAKTTKRAKEAKPTEPKEPRVDPDLSAEILMATLDPVEGARLKETMARKKRIQGILEKTRGATAKAGQEETEAKGPEEEIQP